MLQLPELDQITRKHMRDHFDHEEIAGGYRGKGLSDFGLQQWPSMMAVAIDQGTDASLAAALTDDRLWLPFEEYERSGVRRTRAINARQASERLATSEFGTWYVRGFSARLVAEGVELCEVFRAAVPKYEIAACAAHEGKIVSVVTVHNGHRQRYFPEPGDHEAFSVPFQPGCHHSIRRLTP